MHRIHRQILELELPREEGAVALQRRVSRVFQENVLPQLDKVFSRIAPEGRHIRIERLELDLGDIAEANWEQEFVEKCVAEISRQVAESVMEVGVGSQTKTLSLEENTLLVFRHFLETGSLPWNARHFTLTELEELIQSMSNNGHIPGVLELRRILKGNLDILTRLVWQFSTKFTQKVIESVLELPTDWLPQAIEICQSQTGRVMTQVEFIKFVQHLLVSETQVLKGTPLTPSLLAQMFMEATPGLSIQPPWKPLSETQAIEEPSSKTNRKPEVSNKQPARPDPQGMLVEHAGLVLLAVYLPAFFKKLGISLSESFELSESFNHHHKAVHLLYYLATGREQPEEPTLALPKILCGLALATPVPQDIVLLESEKLEAMRLLEAVIHHWDVLKNTSPDGLRSGFIQRTSLLSWSEERQAWVLQVERLGQDILLERLPWSYSVVKLGWMKEMVQVEW